MKRRIVSALDTVWNGVRLFGKPRAVILLYHRVTELASDPWALAVSPARFEEHMRLIQQVAQPLSLGALVEGLQQGTLPQRAVAITFDDGYADNLYNARPVLVRYGVPATVFVPSIALSAQHEYWWDALDGLLLQPGRLPRTLELGSGARGLSWDLGDHAEYSAETAQRYREWRAPQAPPTQRHGLYQALWAHLHAQSTTERNAVVRQLFEWAGMEQRGRPTHRTLTNDELRCLGQDGLVEVGGHTQHHPSLATLPPHEQDAEIGDNKADLERLIEQPVRLFAYPFGKQSDFDRHTIKSVRQAGFSAAATNLGGVVTLASDPYQLPRHYIHNWHAGEFQRRLNQWFNRAGGEQRG